MPLNRRVRPVPGVTIHLSKHVTGLSFPPGELPVTSPEDTVLDLAASAGSFVTAQPWVHRALRDEVTTDQRLLAAMAARKKLRYRGELAELLAELA